jgi:hypothetical protein
VGILNSKTDQSHCRLPRLKGENWEEWKGEGQAGAELCQAQAQVGLPAMNRLN